MRGARTNYHKALELYRKYDTKKLGLMAREVERDTGYSVEEKNKIGAQKWSSNPLAKDVIDGQKLAERKVIIHGIISIIDLLNEIVASLEATRNEIRTIKETETTR